MKRTALLLAVVLALPACTDRYGRPHPIGNALLGAAGGAAVGGIGSAILRDQQPRYGYGGHRPGPYGYDYRGRYSLGQQGYGYQGYAPGYGYGRGW